MQRLAFAPLLFAIAGILLSSAGVLPAMYGLGLFALGALFGLVVFMRILFLRLRKKARYTPALAVIAVLPLVVGAAIVIRDLRYPPINDITTDLDNPPSFVALLNAPANAGRDMVYPEKFGPIAREAYADIRPLVLNETPERTFQRVEELAKAQSGWKVKNSDVEKFTVEGEATSLFFRFVDDFVIRVSDQDGKARVDMRSKSRDGLVDAGANAMRIRSFFDALSGK